MPFTALRIDSRARAYGAAAVVLGLLAAAGLALSAALPRSDAHAQTLICREGLGEAERAICAALGREAQWALSERAVTALARLSADPHTPVLVDLGNWAETLTLACDAPASAPAAQAAFAKFRPECRAFLAESLNAYLESHAGAPVPARHRWQAQRGDALETLVLSVTPQLDAGGEGPLAKLQRAIERDAARYVRETIEVRKPRADPGSSRTAGPCCAQFIEARAQAIWLGADLASIEISRRNRATDGQESAFRYVTLYNPRRQEEIEAFGELFDHAGGLSDTVIRILMARFSTRREVRDYTYFTLNNLRNFVGDLRRWRLEPTGVTLLFEAGDIAPQTTGAIDERIAYADLMEFIKKDGPLGRALGLQ